MKIKTDGKWYSSKAPFELDKVSKKEKVEIPIGLQGDEILIKLPEYILKDFFPRLRKYQVLHHFHNFNLKGWELYKPVDFFSGIVVTYNEESCKYRIGVYRHDTTVEIETLVTKEVLSERAKKAWRTRKGL